MIVEMYGGPKDGEIVEVPDDCPFIRAMCEENTTTWFTYRLGNLHAYYFPDHRVIQPYGHMRFAFHFIQ